MSTNLREIAAAPLLTPATELTSGQRNWGYLMALIGAVGFSMKAIFVKLAYLPGGGLEANELDAITLLMLRMGFAVPVYIVIALYIGAKRRAAGQAPISLKLIAGSAVMGCTGYYLCAYLDFQGLKLITAQLERLLLFTYPAFVVILGALFFGGRINLTSLGCIALAYSGLGLVFARGDIATGEHVLLGSALLIACAFCFALFQLFAKPMINKIGSTPFTCAAMIASGAAIFLHFLISNLSGGGLDGTGLIDALDLPPRLYIIGAVMAVFSTLIPSFLVNIALGRIGAQAVATIGMISPIATVIAAIVILGEPFGIYDALGTALTILGIGLYTWLDKRAAYPIKNPRVK